MRPMCLAGTATACPSSTRSKSCTARAIPADQVRALSRAYAAEQVERQKKDFIRLGVLGDWGNPYLTMSFKPLKPMKCGRSARFSTSGYLYQGLKPVNWCLDCGSALAEAEVEYEDKNSPAIDVAFEVHPNHADKLAAVFGLSTVCATPAFAVIWTTTPWTLPANEAVSVHPELTYDLVETSKGALILVHELAESACLKRYGLERPRSSLPARLVTSLTRSCSSHPVPGSEMLPSSAAPTSPPKPVPAWGTRRRPMVRTTSTIGKPVRPCR